MCELGMRPPHPLSARGLYHFDTAPGVSDKNFATATGPPNISTIDLAGCIVY
jgi:hypothetical protein